MLNFIAYILGAFTNSSVVILVLNNNLLTELPEGIVDGLVNLQQVSFKHNQVGYFCYFDKVHSNELRF